MNKKCKFIKATERYNTFEEFVSAPYIRKSFYCENAKKVKLTVAACGFYRIYFNGEDITKGFLAPYISNTDHYVYYDEYEAVADEGENVIGVILGNGFQNNPGGYIWEFDTARFRSAPSVALTLETGEGTILTADTSFKCAASPIKSDDYRFGEVYSAEDEIPNWNKKGFDDSLWQNVIEAETPKGELKLCTADPIITEKEIRPIRITQFGDSFIYDFGECNAGVCRLAITGRKGQRIELQHADRLERNGDTDLSTVWFERDKWQRDKEIVHKDVYICKEGRQSYTPTFTYHGFRFVKVSGITKEQVTKDLLTFIVLHSDLKTRGGFSCSDETVNKIQEITLRSNRSNFHYFPTDCPQREKNGWTGDASLSGEQMLLNLTAEKSLTEWLYNIRKAQREDGAIPGYVPTADSGFYWCNGPAWDNVMVNLPYYICKYTGETDTVRMLADTYMRYLDNLETINDENGLHSYGLPDWCQPGKRPPSAPRSVTCSISAMDMTYKMAFLLEKVGMTDKALRAKTAADNYRRAIRESLIDYSTMTVLGNCQTSQAMALYYGVFEADEIQKAFERLLEIIAESGEKIDCGVLGARVLFELLSEHGQTELAYKMITRPDFPSYAYIIKNGATTLWERFEANDYQSLGTSTGKGCSLNHHFWGFVSGWFIKYLGGIDYNPQADDIRKCNIRPHFAKDLDFAAAHFDSVFGRIGVRWERMGEELIIEVTIPEKVSGSIILEKGYCFDNGLYKVPLKNGKYRAIKE